MTLGELFIKIGFNPDVQQLKNAQGVVQNAANAIQSRVEIFKKSSVSMSGGIKTIGTSIQGFFSAINKSANKAGDSLVSSIRYIHIQIVAAATAITMLTKKASDYANELLRVNSVTGISTRALQALQQQAAASGVEAEEVNSALKSLQQQALDIKMGQGNLRAWAMLGIDPNEDPIKVLNQLKVALKGMSPALGAKWANELGLSDKMIMFLKEAGSLGASDRSLLLSEKEIRKLKDFNVFFNRAWDSSKRMLQRLGVAMIPVATFVVNMFERIVSHGKKIGEFFTWFSTNFKGITKALLVFAAVIGVALFPMTAAFLALGLAIDDVMTWFRGGDSLIGRILGPFKEWKATIDSIVLSLKVLEATVKAIFSSEAWSKGLEGLSKSAGSILGIGPAPISAAQTAKNNANATPWTGWKDLISSIFTGKQDVTVNVNGAGNPDEVAKKVVDKINSNTMYQQPVGVK